MNVEMFGTQKSDMPLSFSNFNFFPIYKTDSASSLFYPFSFLGENLIFKNSHDFSESSLSDFIGAIDILIATDIANIFISFAHKF